MNIKHYDCAAIAAADILEDRMYSDLNASQVRDIVAGHVGFVPEYCFLFDDAIYAIKEKWETKYTLPYKAVCPYGYTDCINDPGYIKWYYPNCYKELYGDIAPEDAVKIDHCQDYWKNRIDDDDWDCPEYDDEDK